MAELYAAKLNGVEIAVKTNTSGVEGLEEFVEGKISSSGGGVEAVRSVNGKTGVVNLTASDVKALPDSTVIPTVPGVATTSANGLMSSADKTKLNGIATGAEKNPSAATSSTDGLMSKTDKAKLDALPVITFEKVGTV